uniref:Predicted nucleic acid-binding protein, contains PIN domain n=1 Tax=Candidatus Kentrum sp. DK TaxID=2126562 RepID=A0A450SMS9_9GAMM|nr:MAG: Predicted nucleic acid-binding protein, contains PIN domain [Candidatus Kentron sp. DK]
MVVLDACAIIAFLRDEEGADVVRDALLNEVCVAHAINLCEVYKDCLARGEDSRIADGLLSHLKSIGLRTREDMQEGLWKYAARLKSRYRISLADCFGLALARDVDGQFYTSDHHELDALVGMPNFPTIRFIR